MRAKTSRIGALLVASLLTLSSFSFAADASKDSITQGEAAILLAQYTGLSPNLSPNPSAQECITALLERGITPFGGWELSKILTVADFAKIVVHALGATHEIEGDENDPKTYIQYLKGINIPIESVSETLEKLPSDPKSVIPREVGTATLLSDPLKQGFDLGSEPGDGDAGNVDFGNVSREQFIAVFESENTVVLNVVTPN